MQTSFSQKRSGVSQPLKNTLLGQVSGTTPFWLMRQAGRYLPEYRTLRAKAGSFLDLCFNPVWATEVTLQPISRFDMDAAILFSDILVIPHALGQKLWFAEGEGPRLEVLADTKHFSGLSLNNVGICLAPIYETVARVRSQLALDKTLIGFAGAPWTVACYMLNGKGDAKAGGAFQAVQNFATVREEDFQRLMDILVQATAAYLIAQVKAGADALQIFDSWAGALHGAQLKKWVIAPTEKIVNIVRAACPHTPIIGFARGIGTACGDYARQTGVNAIGLDQNTDISEAVNICGNNVCLQGNLAPELLLHGGIPMEKAIEDILNAAKGHPFVFNLGHGIIKETPIENVARLAHIVKGHGA